MGLFIGEQALFKQGPVQADIILGWCYEADGAVAMLMVVQVRQFCDPSPCGLQVLEQLDRQFETVLQGSPLLP